MGDTMTPEMDMILRLLSRNLELSRRDPDAEGLIGEEVKPEVARVWLQGYSYGLRHAADEITRLRRALEGTE
jgi:hypothetical protein